MKTIFSVVFAFIFYISQCQDSWERKADFPTFRYKAAAFSIGNFGYVGTGMASGKYENDFWKYSPVTDTWTEIDSLPGLDRIGAISFSLNGKGYVGGGNADLEHDEMPLYDFWEYDTSNNNWTKKADIPFKILGAGTTTSFATGNRGFVVRSFIKNEFWEYNPETNVWTQKADYPGEAYSDIASFGITKMGYVGTGSIGRGSTSEFWEYAPATDSWTQKADFPGLPRKGAIAFNIGDKGYLGLGIDSGIIKNDIWEYNPNTNAWARVADCGVSAYGAIAFSIGTKGYAGTGLFMEVSEFWEYTPLTSTVNLLIEDAFIEIFPNPVSDIVMFNNENERFELVSLLDIHGKILKDFVVDGNIINISSIPCGTYFLLFNQNQKVLIKKIIKE